MALTDKLRDMTGTEIIGTKLRLIDTKLTGEVNFFNSGVLPTSSLARDRIDFVEIGKGFNELVKPCQRINPTLLNMPSGSLLLPPHCHPGGEIAYVAEGEYFDASILGTPMHTYPAGSIVFYGAFSTHRPLSRTGARIFYVPLDGIIFPGSSSELQTDDPQKLIDKMGKLSAPGPAIGYARMWMLNQAEDVS